MNKDIYDWMIVMIVFCLIGVIIFVSLFLMGIWVMKFVREKDKQYKKQYDDLTNDVKDIQGVVKNEVGNLMNAIKTFLNK